MPKPEFDPACRFIVFQITDPFCKRVGKFNHFVYHYRKMKVNKEIKPSYRLIFQPAGILDAEAEQRFF